jgi:ankyrin repeat protein
MLNRLFVLLLHNGTSVLLLASTFLFVTAGFAADSEKLMQAVMRRDLLAVKRTLDMGGEINVKDSTGNTALMAACEISAIQIVRELLSRGADSNAADVFGKTALMKAVGAANFQLEMVTELLKHGADVNAADSFGETALMKASKGLIHQQEKIVQELLAHGADVNARKKSGDTALTLAQWSGNDNIVKLLIAKGAQDQTAAVKIGSVELLRTAVVEVPPGPFGGGRATFTLKENEEVVIVKATTEATSRRIVMRDITAFDKAGTPYKSAVQKIKLADSSKNRFVLAFPFIVPKGVRLTKLTIMSPLIEIDIPGRTQKSEKRVNRFVLKK